MDSSGEDVAAAKAALRAQVLARRAGLGSQHRAQAALQITQRLLTLPVVQAARTVLGYAAFGAEVDLDAFLRDRIAAGVAVFLPRVVGPDLRIHRVTDLDGGLVPGWRGVREPPSGLAGDDVAGWASGHDARLQLAVVPGVAFDTGGGRLGYGGGHFDRFLAHLGPTTTLIGIAYDAQLVRAVPLEAHDRRMDLVVTESAETGSA